MAAEAPSPPASQARAAYASARSATKASRSTSRSGQYTTGSSNGLVIVDGLSLGAVRLLGAPPRSLIFFRNNNTTLQVGTVLGDVTIDLNILPQGLSQVGISTIGGNLAITANRGFSNDAATAWASQRSVGGSLTVSENLP